MNGLKCDTGELAYWITKARVKRKSVKRKNLRVQAVLTSTLAKAETLLRMKRQQRLIVEQLKTYHNLVCSDTFNDSQPIQWDEKTRAVIDSLDSFMHLLNEVKSPLQR
jgi:hypothetical protein